MDRGKRLNKMENRGTYTLKGEGKANHQEEDCGKKTPGEAGDMEGPVVRSDTWHGGSSIKDARKLQSFFSKGGRGGCAGRAC